MSETNFLRTLYRAASVSMLVNMSCAYFPHPAVHVCKPAGVAVADLPLQARLTDIEEAVAESPYGRKQIAALRQDGRVVCVDDLPDKIRGNYSGGRVSLADSLYGQDQLDMGAAVDDAAHEAEHAVVAKMTFPNLARLSPVDAFFFEVLEEFRSDLAAARVLNERSMIHPPSGDYRHYIHKNVLSYLWNIQDGETAAVQHSFNAFFSSRVYTAWSGYIDYNTGISSIKVTSAQPLPWRETEKLFYQLGENQLESSRNVFREADLNFASIDVTLGLAPGYRAKLAVAEVRMRAQATEAEMVAAFEGNDYPLFSKVMMRFGHDLRRGVCAVYQDRNMAVVSCKGEGGSLERVYEGPFPAHVRLSVLADKAVAAEGQKVEAEAKSMCEKDALQGQSIASVGQAERPAFDAVVRSCVSRMRMVLTEGF